MPELQFAPLSEFADVTMGQSPDAAACNTEERGLPFLQGCAEFGATHPDTNIYCAPPLRVAKSGSVLISVRAPVGTMNYADQDYCVGRGLGAFKAKPGLANTIFLKHAVELNTGYLHRRSQGSTFAAVSTTDVRNVPVPAFSPQVQGRIASILTSIDTAIEKTEALIAKHQQIKAGLMHDLFTRGVLPNGQLRQPRSEAPELYQETTLGWIPAEWELTGLQAKGRPGVGWIRTGPFGSALKGEHWRTHGHPVITIGALGEGEFLNEELLFVDTRDAARLRDFQLSAGDVVFSRVADVGRSVVIREEQAGWIMSSNLMRIALDANLVRPDYLQMQLAGDSRVKAQIRSQVNSGGRDVANSAVLSRLRFAWPDPAEQDRIISRALLEERSLQAERRKTEKLQQQKLGLMQDLLTGRVPVPAAPEPAEAAA
jgi:type I restriction enzyme S subunit